MDDKTVITFGIHKGKALANIPDQYLLWLWDQDWFQQSTYNDKVELRAYIKENIDVLKKKKS